MPANPDVLAIIEATGLDACNRTELYQMCLQADLKPLPRHTRDELLELMMGELYIDPDEAHEINSWRHGLTGFLLDHWKVLENQLKSPCSGIAADPTTCFRCLDAQVIDCITSQHENNLVQIRKHRK